MKVMDGFLDYLKALAGLVTDDGPVWAKTRITLTM
jgi:hypothetical protein